MNRRPQSSVIHCSSSYWIPDLEYNTLNLNATMQRFGHAFRHSIRETSSPTFFRSLIFRECKWRTHTNLTRSIYDEYQNFHSTGERLAAMWKNCIVCVILNKFFCECSLNQSMEGSRCQFIPNESYLQLNLSASVGCMSGCLPLYTLGDYWTYGNTSRENRNRPTCCPHC